jgi:VWFA-related protein
MKAALPFLFATLLAAQTPKQQPGPSVVIRGGTQEVLLDLVVRDKHERLVRDLKADEVEVLEDGVKQDIRGFRLVSGAEVRETEEKIAAANPGAPKTLNPVREINLVAIVFRMIGGAKERQLAREAAEEFLKTELRMNTYIGVFSLDYKLNALQGFTTDQAALKKAVDIASTQAFNEFAKMSDVVLSQSEFAVSGTGTGGPGGNSGGVQVSGGDVDPNNPNAATAGPDVGTSIGANVMRGILNADRRIFAGNEGIRELEAMKAMVQQLGVLPGRKTVLILTTGLQVPPDQLEVARALVGTANRNNVSLYAVDVNGLTTYSAQGANTVAVKNSARISASQSRTKEVTSEQATQDDQVTYGIRAANQQESLNEVTQNTGGFLIANTNDFKKPLLRIMEDVNTHYEIAYAPKSDVYDGRFRKIEVKLLRDGLRVQSRNGYFAVPDLNGKPMEPFEVAGLKALESKPVAHDVSFHGAVLRFRPTDSGWQQAASVEVKTADLAATNLENPARKRIHVSFLILLKDQTGQVVDKMSKDIPYEIPADKYEAFKAGNITFTQPFSLAPGRYMVEIAVVDEEAQKAGARRVSLVLAPKPAVAVSSILLVRRIDQLQGAADPADPFEFGTTKVTPTLNTDFPKGTDTPLYFVVYPSATNPEKPKVVVDFFRDGKQIGRQVPPVDDSNKDGNGGYPMLASAKLDPGQYEVRVTVLQGKEAAQQSVSFSIQN